MRGSRTQRIVHSFVLEEITGLAKARAEAVQLTKFGLGIAAGSSIALIIIAELAGKSVTGAIGLLVALLISGLPFASIALTYATRFSLLRQNLRLKHLLIGRNQYSFNEARTDISTENGQSTDANFMKELSLFNVAGSLIYDEPALTPATGAAAWEWFGTFAELPSVAIGFSRFGHGGRTYAFVYGSPKTILSEAKDIWDLGHVRSLNTADSAAAKKTLQSWKQNADTSIALAYTPLPADIDIASIDADAITKDLTLLGFVGLHGTREYGRSFPIDPAEAMHTAARSSLSSTLAICFLTIVSYLTFVSSSIPIALGLGQILILKLAVEVLPIASLAWDHARPTKRIKKALLLPDAIRVGLLIGSLAFINYLFYFSRHQLEVTNVDTGSIAHRGAIAVALMSLGLCILADVVMHRAGEKTLSRYQLYNPLFLLGCSSAVLALLIGTYAAGPMAADDLWFGAVVAVVFMAIRELQRYANNHHSREHVLELLHSTQDKL